MLPLKASDETAAASPLRQPLHQRRPFLFQRLPVEPPPRPLIPVVGVRNHALIAVQIRVNRHPLRQFQLVYQPMRPRAVALGVPPLRRLASIG